MQNSMSPSEKGSSQQQHVLGGSSTQCPMPTDCAWGPPPYRYLIRQEPYTYPSIPEGSLEGFYRETRHSFTVDQHLNERVTGALVPNYCNWQRGNNTTFLHQGHSNLVPGEGYYWKQTSCNGNHAPQNAGSSSIPFLQLGYTGEYTRLLHQDAINDNFFSVPTEFHQLPQSSPRQSGIQDYSKHSIGFPRGYKEFHPGNQKWPGSQVSMEGIPFCSEVITVPGTRLLFTTNSDLQFVTDGSQPLIPIILHAQDFQPTPVSGACGHQQITHNQMLRPVALQKRKLGAHKKQVRKPYGSHSDGRSTTHLKEPALLAQSTGTVAQPTLPEMVSLAATGNVHQKEQTPIPERAPPEHTAIVNEKDKACFSEKDTLEATDSVNQENQKIPPEKDPLEPNECVNEKDQFCFVFPAPLESTEELTPAEQACFPEKIPLEAAIDFFECVETSYDAAPRNNSVKLYNSQAPNDITDEEVHHFSGHSLEDVPSEDPEQRPGHGSSPTVKSDEVTDGAASWSPSLFIGLSAASPREEDMLMNGTCLMSSSMLTYDSCEETTNNSDHHSAMANIAPCSLPEDMTSCDYDDPSILSIVSTMDYFYNVSTYGVISQEFEDYIETQEHKTTEKSDSPIKESDTSVNECPPPTVKDSSKPAPRPRKRKCQFSDKHFSPRKHRAGDSSVLQAVKEFCISSMSPALKKQLGIGGH